MRQDGPGSQKLLDAHGGDSVTEGNNDSRFALAPIDARTGSPERVGQRQEGDGLVVIGDGFTLARARYVLLDDAQSLAHGLQRYASPDPSGFDEQCTYRIQ